MQTDTENSLKPTVDQTALLWELVLPDPAFDEAVERCIAKGREDLALYEGTKVYAYQMTLCVITSIFNEAIKLVHFDGELLHIFMKNKLPPNHIMLLKRLFDSKMWLPDKVLHDILGGEQALFSVREQVGDDVMETTYVGLTSYEGPTDYTEIKDLLIASDVLDNHSTVALVYEVGGLRETPYENARYDNLTSRFIGGTERLIDTLMFARELQKDPLKRKAVTAEAERYFAATKFKVVPKQTTQMKLDDARKEAKEAAKPFKTLKKMKKAAKAAK